MILRNAILGTTMVVLAAAAAAEPVVFELSAGIHRIEAELAGTPQTRAIGLMNRRSLPSNRGMLFVFPDSATHCMWMRNTYIPLSVAFIDANGTITNIADMQPESDDNHCARKPARYALEMNSGWFRSRNIGSGARIVGIERVPAPR